MPVAPAMALGRPAGSVRVGHDDRRFLEEGVGSFRAGNVRVDRAEHPLRIVLEYPRMQIIVVEACRQQRLVTLHRAVERMSEQRRLFLDSRRQRYQPFHRHELQPVPRGLVDEQHWLHGIWYRADQILVEKMHAHRTGFVCHASEGRMIAFPNGDNRVLVLLHRGPQLVDPCRHLVAGACLGKGQQRNTRRQHCSRDHSQKRRHDILLTARDGQEPQITSGTGRSPSLFSSKDGTEPTLREAAASPECPGMPAHRAVRKATGAPRRSAAIAACAPRATHVVRRILGNNDLRHPRKTKKPRRSAALNVWKFGAGEAIRTPDPNLGKREITPLKGLLRGQLDALEYARVRVPPGMRITEKSNLDVLERTGLNPREIQSE